MRVRLLFRDRDDVGVAGSADDVLRGDLADDLGLPILWDAMSDGDDIIVGAARDVVLDPLTDPAQIRYRQEVLRECLRRPDTIRVLYALAGEGVTANASVYQGLLTTDAARVLDRYVKVLQIHLEVLTRLQRVCATDMADVRSEGLRRFVTMVTSELDDAYLRSLGEQLAELRFPHGELVSARLGPGSRGVDHVLRRPRNRGLFNRVGLRRPTFSYTVAERDLEGQRALSELRNRGLAELAAAAQQSADHVESFFRTLQRELAFYVGCLRLHEALTARGVTTGFPDVTPTGPGLGTATALADPVLALRAAGPVVTNDLRADGVDLVLVTGPNEGGKTTFLRSLGLATLMAQAGMFVAAESFAAPARHAVYTHFTREEDAGYTSGKFDEELVRMSAIVDGLTPHDLVLSNESFAATNEREGSAIAEGVLRALVDSGVTVVAVTHLYDLARSVHDADDERLLFLRAERRQDGSRTFRVVPGAPEPTSHGRDLFARVFGEELAGDRAAQAGTRGEPGTAG